MSVTDAMLAVSGVATVNGVPYASVDPTAAIVGRGPLKRYGGEKISAVGWSATPVSEPPPATSTRASGRSSAVEGYSPGVTMLASVVQAPLAGDHTSPARMAFAGLNAYRPVPPPAP